MNLTESIFNKLTSEEMKSEAIIYQPVHNGSPQVLTYARLYEMICFMSYYLVLKGIRPGDRVLTYMDRCPELYFAALAIIRCGAVFCPLFSSYGPDAASARINGCGGRAVITQEKYRKLFEGLREKTESLEMIIITEDLMINKPEKQACLGMKPYQATDGEAAVIHYTSGTTGKPKGAVHCHGAISSHSKTGENVLGLKPGEIYWCTADPAWVTGTSYGILAPLACKATILVCDPGYGIEKFFKVINDFKVTILYTAPTLLRMMMREDLSKIRNFNTSSLKWAMCVGEALTGDAIRWFHGITGLMIRNTWFQTETGTIVIANTDKDLSLESLKAEALGRPVEGMDVTVLDENRAHMPAFVKGDLAIRHPWPSMFRGYWNDKERTAERFSGDWYITGDMAYKDDEGLFWFVSRTDDVINTAGHLLSPAEIEAALSCHPGVAEAAVAGTPDDVTGEKVTAAVVLKEGYTASAELEIELRAIVRKRLSPFASPRDIIFMDELPKTESGKIIRRKISSLLKQK